MYYLIFNSFKIFFKKLNNIILQELQHFYLQNGKFLFLSTF